MILRRNHERNQTENCSPKSIISKYVFQMIRPPSELYITGGTVARWLACYLHTFSEPGSSPRLIPGFESGVKVEVCMFSSGLVGFSQIEERADKEH